MADNVCGAGRTSSSTQIGHTEKAGITNTKRTVKKSKIDSFIESRNKTIDKNVKKHMKVRLKEEKKKQKAEIIPPSKIDQASSEGIDEDTFVDDGIGADIKSFFDKDNLFDIKDSKNKANALKSLAAIFFSHETELPNDRETPLMEKVISNISDEINKPDKDPKEIKHLNNMIKSIVDGAKEAFKYIEIEEDKLKYFLLQVTKLLNKGSFFENAIKESGIHNQVIDKVKNVKELTILAELNPDKEAKKDVLFSENLYHTIGKFVKLFETDSPMIMGNLYKNLSNTNQKLKKNAAKKRQKLEKANEKKENEIE